MRLKKWIISTLINIGVVVTISFYIESIGILFFLIGKLMLADVMKEKILKRV
jgi:hypothetical protein